jgi:hypothetical protein
MANMNVQIKWSPKKFEDNLSKADKITAETMEKALQESVEMTAEKARGVLGQRKLTKGNKNLIDSLEKNSSYSITKVFSVQKAQAGTKYPGANLIEEGTKPHSVGWTPIEEWVTENKSVLGFSDVGRATYIIRKLIARRGTKAVEFMEKGVKQADIDKIVNEAAERLLKEVGF